MSIPAYIKQAMLPTCDDCETKLEDVHRRPDGSMTCSGCFELRCIRHAEDQGYLPM